MYRLGQMTEIMHNGRGRFNACILNDTHCLKRAELHKHKAHAIQRCGPIHWATKTNKEQYSAKGVYNKDKVLNTTSKIHPIVTILANIQYLCTCTLCAHCPRPIPRLSLNFRNSLLVGAKTWQLCNQPELLGKKLVNSRSHSLWYQSNVKLELLMHLHLIGIWIDWSMYKLSWYITLPGTLWCTKYKLSCKVTQKNVNYIIVFHFTCQNNIQ